MAYICANFSFPRPLCSPLRPDVCDRQTDVRRASSLNAPSPRGGGIITDDRKVTVVSRCCDSHHCSLCHRSTVVALLSNCSRITVKSKSNRSCNQRITEDFAQNSDNKLLRVNSSCRLRRFESTMTKPVKLGSWRVGQNGLPSQQSESLTNQQFW